MLANWVRETTSTTGTGTITLAGAVAAFIAFGDVFNDGETVHYTIEDGNNREIGLGTFTASGTTLARTTVLETLVSGTFDNTLPTAISLSGSAIVSVTPSSANLISAAPNKIGTGDFIENAFELNNAPASLVWTADNLNLSIFNVLAPLIVEGLTISEVEVADAGSVARMGIYGLNDEGEAGVLLVESDGTFDTATTGNRKTVSVATNLILMPGIYWLGILCDGIPTIKTNATNNIISPLSMRPVNNSAQSWLNLEYAITGGWSAMPADLSAVTPDGFNGFNESPAVHIRHA